MNFIASGLLVAAAIIPLCCSAEPYPSSNEDSPVEFNVRFAKSIKSFRSLEDLRHFAKSKGVINGSGAPGTTDHWRHVSDDGVSYMLATVKENGSIGVDILTNDNVEIIITSDGKWDCEPEAACNPLKNNIP